MPDLSRLAALNESYENAPADPNALPPDGEYQAIVDRFDVIESKKNGRLYLKTEMRVVGGQYNGWSASTLHDLEDPERIQWVKKHLTVLGVVVQDLSRLEEALGAALDVPVLITVKTSDDGEYRNCYVNDRLGSPMRSDLGEPEGFQQTSTNDDDLPF